MKKGFLSFGLIGVFALYLLHQQSEGSRHVDIIIPSSLAVNSLSSSDAGSASAGTPDTSPQTPPPSPSSAPVKAGLGDGSYTGSVADAFYGSLQVEAVISGGKIIDVKFLQYPNDRDTSRMINGQAMPYLKAEAIQSQSANVDIVSGATQTSEAFRETMGAALAQAQS